MTKIDYGYIALTKFGENLCGDNVSIKKQGGYTTFTLADGLGSGVKANILSILTSTMLSTMLSNNMTIEECVETIAKTLPVCKERNVAYSTFTAIQIDDFGVGYMIEFDNPQAILVRGRKCYDFAREKMAVAGKTIYKTKLELELGDYIVTMSDGVTHAGVGITLNAGWTRSSIMAHLERKLADNMSATEIALIVASACNDLYLNEPSDDTTCLAVGLKEITRVNMLIGPPSSKGMDKEVVEDFVSKDGYKIVCGGTTAKIVAEYLNKTIDMDFPIVDPNVPPISAIEGIDLVTEGAVTIKEVAKMVAEYNNHSVLSSKQFAGRDGASLICDYLFSKATDIDITIGQAINQSNAGESVSVEDKQNNLNLLIENLKKAGKEIRVRYN